MDYNKVPFTTTDLIKKLEDKGLSFNDKSLAFHYLNKISYYRLSAYMLPFQTSKKFVAGVTFEDVLNLYNFDSELRSIVSLAIEKIEIAARATIVNAYSLQYGSHWYQDPKHFRDLGFHSDFLVSLDQSVQSSKEQFIRHYLDNYTSPALPPSWMVFEILTFGTLSNLYKQLERDIVKKETAKSLLGVPHPMILESWLHSFSYIRNLCAHHSRFWNRILHVKPFLLSSEKLPSKYKWINTSHIEIDRPYLAISSIQYLLNNIAPNNDFKEQLKVLFGKYPSINLKKMGFPLDWEEEPLWK